MIKKQIFYLLLLGILYGSYISKENFSDNGAEFKNALFNKFFKDNNKKFKNEIPYNLHCTGIIERFNYSIKKYLSKEFIANE